MDRAQAPSPSIASLSPPAYFRGPTPLLSGDSSDGKSSNTSQSLIIALIVVVTSFIVLACYTLYKFYKNRQRRRRSPLIEEQRVDQQEPEEDDDDDEEEEDDDYGPVLDHPIWYIRTAGLQPSVISSITTVRYEKGDGLIEGTRCSVCLNEFEGGESLRLLPKCSHAFHMPCIDTWLSSHTNCPMCRAPIALPLQELAVRDSNRPVEETGGVDDVSDRSDYEEDIRELDSGDRDIETQVRDGVGFKIVIENVKEREERLMVMEDD